MIDLIFNNLRVGHTDEQFQPLLKKGVYFYEYMEDWEKFEEKHLPPIEAFYSKVNLPEISESDYDYAQRVWDEEFGRLSRSLSEDGCVAVE